MISRLVALWAVSFSVLATSYSAHAVVAHSCDGCSDEQKISMAKRDITSGQRVSYYIYDLSRGSLELYRVTWSYPEGKKGEPMPPLVAVTKDAEDFSYAPDFQKIKQIKALNNGKAALVIPVNIDDYHGRSGLEDISPYSMILDSARERVAVFLREELGKKAPTAVQQSIMSFINTSADISFKGVNINLGDSSDRVSLLFEVRLAHHSGVIYFELSSASFAGKPDYLPNRSKDSDGNPVMDNRSGFPADIRQYVFSDQMLLRDFLNRARLFGIPIVGGDGSPGIPCIWTPSAKGGSLKCFMR